MDHVCTIECFRAGVVMSHTYATARARQDRLLKIKEHKNSRVRGRIKLRVGHLAGWGTGA